MTTRLIRSIQRMVMLSAILVLLALLIAFQFEDGRMGFVFLLGALFGVICSAIMEWFRVRDSWFAP